MGMQTGVMAKQRLPTWAWAPLGVCLLVILYSAMRPPHEVLGPDLRRVSTTRNWVFQRPEPGTGILRLRLKKLLFEEAVAVACAVSVVVSARRRRGLADPVSDGSG